jgi:VMA21-like domain.
MLTVPVITFYICFYFIFSNKAEPLAWSGFAAVGSVNIIVAAYVHSAFSEPDEVNVDPRVGSGVGKFDNDASRPRVGAFKQRTD